jgi:hypothetical protein
MIVSILMRKTRVSDRAQAEALLASLVPRVKAVLEGERGFVSVQYLWGADEEGQMGQITSWQTLEDCRHYVRQGGAAMVATLEEAALPTAPHPDGAWVRKTFESVS